MRKCYQFVHLVLKASNIVNEIAQMTNSVFVEGNCV
jgi:hypothetical protein